MTGLVSKPKTQALPPVKELPTPDDDLLKQQKRREAAARIQQSGTASTRVSERQSKSFGA